MAEKVDFGKWNVAEQVRGQGIITKKIMGGKFWDILGTDEQRRPVDNIGFRFNDLMIVAEPHIYNIEHLPSDHPDYPNIVQYDIWALGEGGQSLTPLIENVGGVNNHSSREVVGKVIHELFSFLTDGGNNIHPIQIPKHVETIHEQVIEEFQKTPNLLNKPHSN